MNSKDFKTEVLNSAICPEGFEDIYEEFEKYQKLAADALKEFHRICEKNQITYQLAFGSLLGAVRDNGQIPWDYDVDVFISHTDRIRLIDAFNKDLSEKFYYDCLEVNKHCSWFFLRLAPKGYDAELLHVDIYQLFGVPDEKEECLHFLQRRNELTVINRIKRCTLNDQELIQGGIKKQLGMIRAKIRNLLVRKDKVIHEIEEMQSQFDLTKSKSCTSLCSVYKELIFPTEYLDQTVLIETNMGKLRISKNYDPLLKIIYGDYLRIYPLENRLYEMMNSYYRIKHKKNRLGPGTRYYTKKTYLIV